MTDSHNSGQHKDREAAAAEVRRMWQPTPSWIQPDPNHDGDPGPAEADEKPDALSADYPADSWSRPADQPAPWTQPQSQPQQPAQSTPSWTQPVAESAAAWTQPAAEPDEFEEAGDSQADEQETSGATAQTDTGTTPAAGQGGAASSPVFGGASFNGSGSGYNPPAVGTATMHLQRCCNAVTDFVFLEGVVSRDGIHRVIGKNIDEAWRNDLAANVDGLLTP